ncbi:MAG: (Fe-S)-binding protein [Deltaproteobacteria bacterium]|nr:(Fe-S)-binding protein [Deltaproteobacteria bacterium]
MRGIKELIEEAGRCVRCGACKSVCPTYDVLRREQSGPRGRLSLVEASFKGESGFGGAYLKNIKECTLCGSCHSNCPNGVNIPELILAARAEGVEKGGLSLAESFAYRGLLHSERFMQAALRLASRLQGLFLKGTAFENGLVSRFSLPVIGGGRLLPELADEFFLDRSHIEELSPSATPVRGKKGGVLRVGFFAGCGVNYLLPDIGEATIRVLKESGAEVVVPQQVCCGMPAYSAGDRRTARDLALKNLEAFEASGVDIITTSCATCGHGLKKVFAELLSDEGLQMRSRVERFASMVRDITELLTGELPYKGGEKGKKGGVVTYHDPCHLRRYQGISEEPRRLLSKSVFTFKGMKHPCRCCGLGGGVGFANYELSMEIAKEKASSVRATGADVVATACPGCMVQLKDALYQSGVKARVAHVVELL